MRFGLTFPNFGTYAEPSALVDLAVAADRGGWDGFFVWDHIVIADSMPVADPWVVLGAIALATERVRIGPMVAALPRHRPWIVARQAVSIDRLSGGRMVLGVGIGYPPREEFGTFGDPEDDRMRADMLDEGLAVIEGVWSGEPFAFAGAHYSVAETSFRPQPIQQPRIPIWVAGMLPFRRPLRRAARYDGVVPIRSDMDPMSPAEVAETKAYVDRHREGHRPYEIVIGGPPHTSAEFEEFERAGVTWYLAGPHPAGEPLAETLAWVAEGPASYFLS